MDTRELPLPALIGLLDRVRKNIEGERGEFSLFAAFRRKRSRGSWDLMLAANWLTPNALGPVNYVYEKLREVLSAEQMTEIGRVVALDPVSAIAQTFTRRFSGKTGVVKLRNFLFAGQEISRAYVLRLAKGTQTGQRVRKVRKSAASSDELRAMP